MHHSMEPIVFIMRGVGGTGKTDIARMLVGEGGRIHSTNDFFMERGRYCFDGAMLEEYHAQNKDAFEESLQAGISRVACDNTNLRNWEWAPYANMAHSYGYNVVFVEMPHPNPRDAAENSVHGLTAEIIQNQIDKWEPRP